jgi:hypothetical protein
MPSSQILRMRPRLQRSPPDRRRGRVGVPGLLRSPTRRSRRAFIRSMSSRAAPTTIIAAARPSNPAGAERRRGRADRKAQPPANRARAGPAHPRTAVTNVKDKIMGRTASGSSAAPDTAGSTASSLGRAVSSAASAAKGKVASTASSAVGPASSAPEMARRRTEGNPLAAGLIVFGAGAYLASLLPATTPLAGLASERTSSAGWSETRRTQRGRSPAYLPVIDPLSVGAGVREDVGATARPGQARRREAAGGGHPCHQPSLNGDSCGENPRGS